MIGEYLLVIIAVILATSVFVFLYPEKAKSCANGYHSWTAWKDTMVETFIFGKSNGIERGQQRECSDCGIKQIRSLGDKI